MMKSLATVYSLLALALLVSCGPGGNTFRIKGQFTDMQSGELYIYCPVGDKSHLDTLTVREGRFLYQGTTTETVPYILVFPNGVEQVVFVSPGSVLNYSASANNLLGYEVSGSEENDIMNKYRADTRGQTPSHISSTTCQYIKEYANSPVALYLFDRYIVQNEDVDSTQLGQLIPALLQHHPHNRYLLSIQSAAESLQALQRKQPLADASLIALDGESRKLWHTASDYNLIVFWSAWSTSASDILWKLRRAKDKLPENTSLRIVTISLDIDRQRWRLAVMPDSTTAYIEHYCDGMGFESKAVKQYGISSVPYIVLADRDHKILDMSDDATKLDNLLQKHIIK